MRRCISRDARAGDVKLESECLLLWRWWRFWDFREAEEEEQEQEEDQRRREGASD